MSRKLFATFLVLFFALGPIKTESLANAPQGLAAVNSETGLRPLDEVLEKLPPNTRLPPFLIYDLNTPPQSITSLIKTATPRPQRTFLVFWADWCPPCLQELKTLDKFLEKHKKDLEVANVQIRTIALSPRGDSMIPVFFKRHNLQNLDGFWNKDETIMTRLGIEGLPTTFLLDSGLDPASAIITHKATAPIDWTEAGTIRHILSP